VVVSAYAAAVLTAWVVHFVPLIQLSPGQPPLTRQGALAELLLGAALVFLAAGRQRAAAFSATTVLTLAVLVGFQYLLNRDFGIDELLGSDYIRRTSPPGRISPVAALCYLGAGLALLAMSTRRLARYAAAIAGMISSILIATGTVMFLAYGLGQNTVYAWGHYRRISVQAAAAVALLGVGIIVLALEESRTRKSMSRWLPLALALGLSAGALGVWQALMFHEPSQLPLLSHIILAGGILGALLVAISVYLAQKATLRSRQFQEGKDAYERLFEASPDSLVVIDGAGRIVGANERSASTFGYTREELPGLPLESLVPERLRELHSAVRQDYRSHPGTRPTGQGLDLNARRKDGSEFPVDVSLSVLLSAGELQVLAVVRDITARKQAEEALLQSEKRFRTVFERSPLGLGLVYPDNRIITFSDSVSRMLGYSKEELEGMSPLEVTHPEDREESKTLAERLFKGEIPSYKIEKRYVKKNGEIMWATLTATGISDREGRFLYSLGMMEDITERKRAQEELKSTEQRLALALAAGQMGAWALDLTADRAWRSLDHDRIFGYTELLPTWSTEIFFSHVFPEDLESVQRAFAEAYESGRLQFECRITRADNIPRWISAEGSVVYNEQHTPVRMLGVVKDITERKMAQQKVAEQAALLDLAHDTIFVHDLEGRITFWNRGAADTYGWTANEVLGRQASELLQTKLPIPREEVIAKVQMEGAWEGELEHTTRDGRKLDMTSRWSLQRDERGAPAAILEISRDITARKQLEQDLEAAREQAISSARLSALGMMAGGIAHEINNPLSVIHALASDLKEMVAERGSAPPEMVVRTSTVIGKTAERIAKIVKSLRQISREGSGDLFHPTAVSKILGETLEVCRAKFKANGVELRLPQAIPEVSIPCREVQIAQALLNLLQNAFDAALEQDGERWVRLEVKPGDGRVAISVIDSGPGVPSELHSRIGEPFFTTKPVGKGTGLGLSLSKSIVEDHGGSLEYDQDHGHTRFSLVLPLAREAKSA
jgi:PAS domain S-box-containing protein